MFTAGFEDLRKFKFEVHKFEVHKYAPTTTYSSIVVP